MLSPQAQVRAAVGTQASMLRLRMAVRSVARGAMSRTPVARGRRKRHHDQLVCSPIPGLRVCYVPNWGDFWPLCSVGRFWVYLLY